MKEHFVNLENLNLYDTKIKQYIKDNSSPSGSYAPADHNHDSVYAKLVHNHQASEITEDVEHKFITQQNLDSINELLGSVKFCTVTYNSGANGMFGDGSTTLTKKVLFGQSLPEFPVLNINQGYELVSWDTNDKDSVVSGIVNKDLVFNVIIYEKVLNPQECDYYFETRQDFNARIDAILTENNDDLSQKTFGFGDGITSLSSAFCETSITSTPKTIVARNVTDFFGCFNSCASLTTILSGLFDNCPKAADFSYCFPSCYSLTTIPAGLFNKCVNATDFSSCFDGCALTTIPTGLFDKNVNVIKFGGCFSYCSSITMIPAGLFDNCTNVTNFGSCFSYCSSITSSLPDVWNKVKFPKVTDGTSYAESCTKAANYNEIPSNFGGPSGNPAV